MGGSEEMTNEKENKDDEKEEFETEGKLKEQKGVAVRFDEQSFGDNFYEKDVKKKESKGN